MISVGIVIILVEEVLILGVVFNPYLFIIGSGPSEAKGANVSLEYSELGRCGVLGEFTVGGVS